MAVRDETTEQNRAPTVTPRGTDRVAWLSIGGILAAFGTVSCCVVPFALFTLGISGAWVGNLTALEPYRPIFASVALGFIGYGGYLVYCGPKVACADGSYCARPASTRIAKVGLWSAAVLVAVALAAPYLLVHWL